jgi:hypothetical protein
MVTAVAFLLARSPATHAIEFNPICPEVTARYLGNNQRLMWVLRSGSATSSGSRHRPVYVYEVIADDGQIYILHGSTRERLRLVLPLGEWARRFGALRWEDEVGVLPPLFHIMADDGSPGPVFSFEGCEAGSPPKPQRVYKEYWD